MRDGGIIYIGKITCVCGEWAEFKVLISEVDFARWLNGASIFCKLYDGLAHIIVPKLSNSSLWPLDEVKPTTR